MPEPVLAHAAGVEPAPTLGSAARKLSGLFEEAGLASPRLDARILVAEACGRGANATILDRDVAVSAEEAARIAAFAARRLAGEPVSRILGRREFWGLTFRISPDTLDPRPETELLVETVLEHVRGRRPPHSVSLPAISPRRDCILEKPYPQADTAGREDARTIRSLTPSPLGERVGVRGDSAEYAPLRILDLGTGSGCILGALLSELPQAQGIGLDRSEAALAVARDNLSLLGLQDRASFLCAHWMSAIAGGAFDVIVCNPPYIAPSEIRELAPEVRAYDPYLALDGGEDGLNAYRTIIPQAFAALRGGGLLVFEVGYRQAGDVLNLMKLFAPAPGFSEARILRDLGGVGRAVAAVRQS